MFLDGVTVIGSERFPFLLILMIGTFAVLTSSRCTCAIWSFQTQAMQILRPRIERFFGNQCG
jgi:hypothetical protein